MDFLLNFGKILLSSFFSLLHLWWIILPAFFLLFAMGKGSFFWVFLHVWVFWGGKSYNVYRRIFMKKKTRFFGLIKPSVDYIISNNPYPFIDLQFDTKEDLSYLIIKMKDYMVRTNTIFYLLKNFPKISLICDEAQLYFFSRDFKTLEKDMLVITTQSRKRLFRFDFITQELPQLDVFFRRLTPYILEYTPWLLWVWFIKKYHMLKDDTDIRNPQSAERVSWDFYVRPGTYLSSIIQVKYKDLEGHAHLTKYIVGVTPSDDFKARCDLFFDNLLKKL